MRDVNPRSPLALAATNGQREIVKILLLHGARPEALDTYDWDPLHWAALLGDFDATALALAQGSDPNVRNGQGSTPLHIAAAEGHLALVEMLLTHGADLHARDEVNDMPLHVAAREGRHKIVEILLARGANPNALNEFNWTPYHMTVAMEPVAPKGMSSDIVPGSEEIDYAKVKRLLYEHGADSVHYLWRMYHCLEEQEGLLLRIASFYGNQDIGRYHSCSLGNTSDFSGRTPLHMAAGQGHLAVMQVLLAHGAKPEARDERGRTAWHWALNAGYRESASLLIAYGADLDPADG